MKRLAVRLSALLLGLLLALALAELVVRVARPGVYDRPMLRSEDGSISGDLSEVIGFLMDAPSEDGIESGSITQLAPHMSVLGCYDRPAWDYFDDQGCVSYRTNALGFRDDEFPLQRPAGERRVIAIGDSFTFGIGVPLEATWSQVVERGLTAAWHAPVQVVNAGFAAGFMPSYYTDWLLDAGLRLDPELVVVGVCLNDLGEIPMLAYGFDEPPSGSMLLDWVRRRMARRAVEQGLERMRTDPKAKRFDFKRVIDRDPRTWEGTQRALRATRDGLAAHGVGLVVAVFPMLSQLASDYPYQSLHDMLVAFCQAEGIEVVDLGPRFRGQQDTALWAHPTDQHPNDRGQAMLGAGILEYLLDRDR